MKDADELTSGPRGVDQRSQDVEYGPDSHFCAGPGCGFGCRMMGGSIHEPHTNRVDALAYLIRRQVQLAPEDRKDVGSAAFAGNGAIPVLGDRNSASCDYECCSCGNIESIAGVAA